MFRAIHPNRWFLYALAAPVILFMLMMWRIGLDIIAQRTEAANVEEQSSLSLFEIHNARANKIDLKSL